MRLPSLLLLALLVPLLATAQPETDQAELNESLTARVAVLARGANDSVVVRWAVTKPAVWLAANRVGYIVERAESAAEGQMPRVAEFKRVAGPVKPWDATAWERYFDTRAPLADTGAPDYPMAAAAFSDPEGAQPEIPASDDLQELHERRSRLNMRFGFAMLAADRSIVAAEGLGLRFVDRTVKPGVRYVYRVYPAGAAAPYRVDTGYVTVTAAAYKPSSRKGLLRAVENEGSILVNWNAIREYSSYLVDRSADKGRTFQRVTRVPMLTARPEGMRDSLPETYLDSGLVNYRPYTYRVYGTTAFADEELIGEITAMGRDRTPPGRPFVPNPAPVAGGAAVITWEMDAPVAGDLAGFIVLRDTVEEGTYTPVTPKLLPPGTRSFTDTEVNLSAPNYYTVAAFDTAGNFKLSNSAHLTLVDSVGPGRPMWLKGTMDSNGVVTLVLRKGGEGDRMGYRILRANAADHEFASVMEAYGDEARSVPSDTVLRDTVEVRTLTRYVYYRAVALDWHYNESEPSEILAVPRPDLIPPVAPMIVDVGATDTSVVLSFVPSTSEDVARHTVYRREQGGERWDSVAVLARDARSFVDLAIRQNVRFDYSLDAVDSAGLRSERAAPVTARPYDPGMRPGVAEVAARYDSSDKRVELTWRHAGLSEEYRYIVYRSSPGKVLKQFASVESSARSYSDTRLHGPGPYSYVIKVVTRSGAESLPSEPRKVEVR